jgi:hypothetical protein
LEGGQLKKPHQDQESQDDSLCNPVVYFTIAIPTDIPPRTLISGIKTEWEMHGGGKLQVKVLQLQESKVVLTLYYVYTGTPYSIILKTLHNIMRDATSSREHERTKLTNQKEFTSPPIPGISLCAQVPRLKGINSSAFDKLPYHVKENRKVLHIKTNPANEAHLKDLIQYAKERSILTLFLGKCARVSEVMDNDSTLGEVNQMVKFAIGHANYQGSMTGETIFGIDLLDGEVAPITGGGKVSLQMILFTYFKMKD